MKSTLKKVLPHAAVIAIFITITLVYFSPLLKEKALKQGDIVSHKGMSKEIADYREKNQQEPLWTNSMFGGMPAYQISVIYSGNLIRYVDNTLKMNLPHPASLVFIYLLGFYILLLTLKIDPWLSFLGSLAFAFSSYFFIIIEAGHNSKAHAIGYMAPVIAGVILTMRGKYFLGGVLTALFLAIEIYANHLQITYYLAIFIIIYIATESYRVIQQKKWQHLLKTGSALIIAAVLAVGSNAGNLLVTSSYVKHTTRGKSELTINKQEQSSGLDKDYATSWSYGKGETMTLLVPNFKGGASGYLSMEKNALKNVDSRFKENISQMDRYWGDQPFTSGPVYVGALVFALSIMGLFILRSRLKWILLIVTILSVTLAWGRNFMWLTDFFLDYVPGYNKFRTVSMILVLAELTIPLLAILALDKFLNRSALTEKIKIPFVEKPVEEKKMSFIALGISAGLCFLFYVFPDLFNTFYKSGEYNEIYSQVVKSTSDVIARDFLDNLAIARKAVFKPDVVRSLIFIVLGLGVLWYYAKSKLNKKLVVATLSVFVLADMWNVNKRYLNNDSFVTPQEVKVPFQLSQASKMILEDKAPDYRVLNIAVNTFNDASTSYYHKSVGGYHAAKLGRYQELIEYHISPSIQSIISVLKSNPSDSSIKNMLSQQGVLNMLNTKYVIYNSEAPPLKNNYALGAAWFVPDYKLVVNADSELLALNNLNPANIAVIDKRFASQLDNFKPAYDSSAVIQQTGYQPNHLIYISKAASDQLAVFSEIYYNEGWNVYIDGQKTDYVRANYVLRSMKIPKGEHKIEFKFEPETFNKGESISYASSGILLLLVGFVLFIELRKQMLVNE